MTHVIWELCTVVWELWTLETDLPESSRINQLPLILMIFQGKETNFEWIDISFRDDHGVVQQTGIS